MIYILKLVKIKIIVIIVTLNKFLKYEFNIVKDLQIHVAPDTI